MPWGDNGVTNRRFLLDQSATYNWTNSIYRVGTRALNQVGYLRRILLKIPPVGGQAVITAGNPLAVGAAADAPQERAINSFDLTAQGIAPVYQIGRGLAFRYLEYLANGSRRENKSYFGNVRETPASGTTMPNTSSLGAPSAKYETTHGIVTQGGGDSTHQNVLFAATYDVPLTEWVRFPAQMAKAPDGSMVAVAAQEAEVGLLTLQNTQQNVVPHATLNPLWQPNASTVDAPYIAAATQPTSLTLAAEFDIWTEFYDVPANPGDQPPWYSQAYVITRTTVDDPVTGGGVTHNFQPAGLLLRAIYVFLDTNGAVVDVSNGLGAPNPLVPVITGAGAPAAPGPDATKTFKWGATVIKSQERASVNLTRAAERYGEPPPVGCLIDDFFVSRELTEPINTAILTSVQTQITGLPAAVTTMMTIEERMIPVRLGG